jgi:predicted TIM-barrel fold metal-dependent hydrolase
VSVFDEPKIDTHCHVLDPARFPYAPDVAYRPAGQEAGTLAQYLQVMDAYGIRHALLVGPNSGYGLDNRCMLDAVRQGNGRFRGIAVVKNDISAPRPAGAARRRRHRRRVQRHGAGVDYYAGAGPLLRMLADLDMLVSVQVEHDQLVAMRPLLEASGVRLLVDHGGRPKAGAGVDQPGFQALLAMARSGRVAVKLSGVQKFSRRAAAVRRCPPCSCARWSMRSRPTPACGLRTGRS